MSLFPSSLFPTLGPTVAALLEATTAEVEPAHELSLSADGRELIEVSPSDATPGPRLAPASDPSELVRLVDLDLGTGTVEVAFAGAHPLEPGGVAWLDHDGITWTLSLSEQAPWTLEFGDHPHRMQALETWPTAGEAPGIALLWAGDADRDGVLDLLMAMSDDAGADVCTLLLSSRAEGEAHVAQAARMVRSRAPGPGPTARSSRRSPTLPGSSPGPIYEP